MCDVIILNNIENILEGSNCYNYKGGNFVLKYKKNSKYLIVGFHGLVYPNENIYFAKTKWNVYDINNDDFSILCINDKFLEENRNLITSAYHNFENCNYENLYVELINIFFDFLKPVKTIFFGVSIGAIPALYYGSKFKSIILCLNSYIYLSDKDYDNIQVKLKHKIKKINIEENILKNNNIFEKIIIYANKNDLCFFNDSKKFILFSKRHIPDKIKFIIHDDMTINNNGHSSYLPPNTDLEKLFLNLV